MRCKGQTKNDRRCRLPATKGSEYCQLHIHQKPSEGAFNLSDRAINTLSHKLKYQALIIFSITSIILLLNYYISKQIGIENLLSKPNQKDLLITLLAVSIATSSILYAFVLFHFQSIENRKFNYYCKFRKSVDKLQEFYFVIPDELLGLKSSIADAVQWGQSLKASNFPIVGEEWNILAAILEDAEEQDMPFGPFSEEEADPDQQRLLAILLRIEEYGGLLGVLTIETLISGIWVDIAKRSVLVMGFTILALVVVLIDSKNLYYQGISAGMVMATLSLGLFNLFGMMNYAIRYYSGLLETMNKSPEDLES